MKTAEVTVKECLDWAKDRLVDDVKFGLLGDLYQRNFAAMNPKQKGKFILAVARFGELMSLPATQESLDAMQEAGYWNGVRDTYLEERGQPSWL